MKKFYKGVAAAFLAICTLPAVSAFADVVEPFEDPLANAREESMPLFVDECDDLTKIFSQSGGHFSEYVIDDLEMYHNGGGTLQKDKAIRIVGERAWWLYRAPNGGTINDLAVWLYMPESATSTSVSFYLSKTARDASTWDKVTPTYKEQNAASTGYKECLYYLDLDANQVSKGYRFLRIVTDIDGQTAPYRYLTEVRLGYMPKKLPEATGSFVDTCTNFDLVYQTSLGLVVQEEAGEFTFGRDYFYNKAEEFVIYESPGGDIKTVSVTNWNNYDDSDVLVYVSPDGINWESLTTERFPEGYEWGTDDIYSSDEVPKGNRYLKVVQRSFIGDGSDPNWPEGFRGADRLKRVEFTYEKDCVVKWLTLKKFVTDERKLVIDTLPKDEQPLTLTTTIANNTDEKSIAIQLFIAEYNEAGTLIKAVPGEARNCIKGYPAEFRIEYVPSADTTKIKAFVWDGDSLAPLSDLIEVPREK